MAYVNLWIHRARVHKLLNTKSSLQHTIASTCGISTQHSVTISSTRTHWIAFEGCFAYKQSYWWCLMYYFCLLLVVIGCHLFVTGYLWNGVIVCYWCCLFVGELLRTWPRTRCFAAVPIPSWLSWACRPCRAKQQTHQECHRNLHSSNHYEQVCCVGVCTGKT